MANWHDLPDAIQRNAVAVAGTLGWIITDSRFIGGITACWVLIQMAKFLLTWWREERDRWKSRR